MPMELLLFSIVGFFLAVGGLWFVMRIAVHSINALAKEQALRDEENDARLKAKREAQKKK